MKWGVAGKIALMSWGWHNSPTRPCEKKNEWNANMRCTLKWEFCKAEDEFSKKVLWYCSWVLITVCTAGRGRISFGLNELIPLNVNHFVVNHLPPSPISYTHEQKTKSHILRLLLSSTFHIATHLPPPQFRSRVPIPTRGASHSQATL